MRYIVIFYYDFNNHKNVFLLQSEEKAIFNGWIRKSADGNILPAPPTKSRCGFIDHTFVFTNLPEASLFIETMKKTCIDKTGEFSDQDIT